MYSVLEKIDLSIPNIWMSYWCVWEPCDIIFSIWYPRVFQEDFLDLTVAVKNVSGLEDALWNMYVEEEVFDYDNLYHCGTCDRLVTAAKVKRGALPFLRGPTEGLAAGRLVKWSQLVWKSLEDMCEALD